MYKNRYFEENPNSVIKPYEIETLAYGEFLRDLKTVKPVYIFNYDWRLSSSGNGKRLAEYMGYLIDKSNARDDSYNAKYKIQKAPIKSFDFVTHSLGNFILRNYINDNGFKNINKVVFTVPPFKGSSDIVSAAIVGEGFFPGVKAKIRKILRVMPGALELLPNYLNASMFDMKGKHSFFNFIHWQSNITSDKGPIPSKIKKALSLSSKNVNNNLCDLSAHSDEERKRILVIARGGFETWQSINVLKKGSDKVNNFVDFENGLKTDDGDGRVPHVSSCCYFDSVQTLMLEDTFWYRDYSHGFVLKDERTQKLVNRFLFDKKI